MKNLAIISVFLLLTCNKSVDQSKDIKKEENPKLENILGHEDVKSKKYVAYKDDKFDFNDKKLYEDLQKAIYKGDTLAYKSASKYYIVNGRYKEFLYYAILMAEKNNYKEAYWDVSTILTSEPHSSFTSQYASYCLLKAFEMGDKGAIASVDYVYTQKGKKIPKSSSIYSK